MPNRVTHVRHGPPALRHRVRGVQSADLAVAAVHVLLQRFIRLEQWSLVEAADTFWRLYWPTAGEARLVHDGRLHTITPGCLYLIPPYTRFSTECHDRCSKWFIHFTLDGFTPLIRPQIVVIEPTDRLREVLAATCPTGRGRIAASGRQPGHAFQVVELVSLVVRAGLPKLLERRPPGSLEERVLRLLEQRPTEKLSLETLARATGLTERKLTALVDRLTGFTPMRYRLELRLNEAMRLLRAGDLPIEDVARRCGFPNRYYFTRMFSRHRHMTPAAYRRGSGG